MEGTIKMTWSQGKLALIDVLSYLWQSFLELDGFRSGGRDPEMYFMFTVEPLQYVCIGI